MARIREQEPTWPEAILKVLTGADGAMHYTDIAAEIIKQGIKVKVGATPALTVASVFSKSRAEEDSPFLTLGKGQYTLKDKPEHIDTAPEGVNAAGDTDTETGALRAFGMFWRRGEALWTGKPKLIGRQQIGASNVNFAEQVGVYLLHDRDRVIYVGRAADTMYARLKAHTTDRMGGRWDRFSWFGLRSVGEDGSLMEPSAAWTHNVVIETLEALLIESLEPPLNRKRGDNFSGVEYLQVVDPEIENIRKKQIFKEMASQVGLSID